MVSFADTNIFADASLLENPHPYYDYLRGIAGAVQLPHHDVVATVGYDETLAVLRDDQRFSAVNSTSGPLTPLPFTPEGNDITDQIERHRGEMSFAGLIATQDPPVHTKTRLLAAGLITPRRLRENEAFMWRLADREIDTFAGRGGFEVSRDLGLPFATQAVADLLGVPEADHATFTELLGTQQVVPGQFTGTEHAANNPLEAIGAYFYQYLSDRRETPRGDVLTELAQAKYPGGVTPDLADVIGIAAFLFAAGQDTTVSLITAALRILAETPELQRRLRVEREKIPDFIEEVLRLEGTVKANFRLAKVPISVGGLDLRPGTTVMLILAAANRDPARFERPHELILERKNLRDQLSFGRGVHACIGSPLARAEAKIAVERLFDRLGEFRIDERFHGPRDARRYEFKPSFMFRILKELHLEFDPVS
jgi:cytochrome P450